MSDNDVPRSTVMRDAGAYFATLLIVVVTWAVGIPRFGSPDEPAHVYKAYATAHEQLLGKPAEGFPNNLREFDGPAILGPPNLNCYVGQPDVPASCATEISPRLISSAARYPPWYYGLVGAPVTVTGQSEHVLAYRLVSAVLCVALLALAMLLGKRSTRGDVVALQLVALTPMALFLMASVNPNAMEIAIFVVIWACLTRVASDAVLPERLLILASLLSAAVVLMRPISIVWLAGVVLVALIGVSPPRRRELWSGRLLAWMIAPTAGALVVSWLWTLYARFEVQDDRVAKPSLSSALHRSVRDWPGYLRQAIGVLGWLDTILPTFVYIAWFAALVIVVLVDLRSASARGVAALVAIVGVWLALPLIINGFTSSRAGITYQGRYSLPIFVGLVFLPMWGNRSKLRWPRLSQQYLVLAALALVVVAEVVAFWQMLRRFTVGADGKILLTGKLPWSPSIAPMLLVVINTAAMLGLAWSAWRPWGRVERSALPFRQIEAATGEGNRHGS